MRSLRSILRLLGVGLAASLALPTVGAAETTTFGPVQLRPDQRFQLCMSAPDTTETIELQASFHPIRNPAAVIQSQSRALNPGEGGCVAVDFLEASDASIFAVLQTPLGSENLVSNACIVDGVFFDCVEPVAVFGFGNEAVGTVITEVATFGPVRLKEDSALEVCISNPFNPADTDVTFSFFNARSSGEPVVTRSITVPAGRGGCVSLGYDRVGNTPIFARVTYEVTVETPNTPVGLVRGAAIIDGIFITVPGQRHLMAVL